MLPLLFTYTDCNKLVSLSVCRPYLLMSPSSIAETICTIIWGSLLNRITSNPSSTGKSYPCLIGSHHFDLNVPSASFLSVCSIVYILPPPIPLRIWFGYILLPASTSYITNKLTDQVLMKPRPIRLVARVFLTANSCDQTHRITIILRNPDWVLSYQDQRVRWLSRDSLPANPSEAHRLVYNLGIH